MLDVRLFARSSFSGAVLANLLSVFSLVGFLFFVSQHLQLVLGESPMQAGLILLPGLVVTIVAGLAGGAAGAQGDSAHVVAGGLLISAAGYAAVLLGAHQRRPVRLGVGLRAAVAGHRRRRDDLQRRDHLQRPGRQGRCGVGDLGDRLRDRRGPRHRRPRRDPHRVVQRQVVVPAGVSAADATSATETLGGATAVAAHLPQPQATELLTSAQQAFGAGVGVTSVIAVVLMVAAAVLVWVTLRGKGAES